MNLVAFDRVRSPLLVSLLILGASVIRGQVTTATFYGSVTDPTGAAVAAATATLSHQETGAVLTRTSGAEGEFSFDFLRVGHYTLAIQASGFKRYGLPSSSRPVRTFARLSCWKSVT